MSYIGSEVAADIFCSQRERTPYLDSRVRTLLNYHPACKPQSPQTDQSVPKKEKYAMDEFDSVLSNHLDKAQHTMATNGQRENYDDANVKTQNKRLTMLLNHTNTTNVTLPLRNQAT